MIYTVSEIANKIEPIAKRYDILKVYLFGSYVRCEADEESDIDLAIEFSPLFYEKYSLFHLLDDLEETFSKKVDLMTVEQIQKGRSPIAQEVKNNFNKERIVVYEREII